MVASRGVDRTVKLWEVETGQELRTLGGHLGLVLCVSFSPDGERIVSADPDKIKLWEVETGQELRTLGGHLGLVRCVSFSPDGERIVSKSMDGSIIIWDATEMQELRTAKQ